MPNFSGVPASLYFLHNRRERRRGNRMRRMRDVQLRIGLLHLFPDVVGNGDAVAVQIHAERRDDVCLRADADGRGNRLAGQHVRAVQFAGDDAVEQNFPVRLRLKRNIKSFVIEIAVLLGNHQRRAVGQFDEAEFEHGFFHGARPQRATPADETRRARPLATAPLTVVLRNCRRVVP